MHTYIHAYMHTYIHAYIHTYMHTYIHTYIHTCIHTYIHTYMHTCIHTYIHTSGNQLPFHHVNGQKMYELVTRGTYATPAHLSKPVKDILSRMLAVEPQKRSVIKVK
jgi:hypothetical protein